MKRRLIRLWLALLFVLVASSVNLAQQRPLLTEDVDIIKPGVVRIESSIDFLQDIKFPLSGLRGDLTRLANTRLSFGLAPNVEVQIEWTVHNFLSIDGRGPSAVPLRLGGNSSDANDVGDVTIWTKLKLKEETERVPSIGFRFGARLPNSDQSRGIGTNTTDFYAMITAGKMFREKRLNVFGNVGLGILQAPVDQFTQNDVLLYGLAGIYTVNDRLNLVGEVNGFYSTRRRAPLGTEDYSEARLGAQIRALGLRWNAAGIFGLTDRAPRTGFTLGITYDWEAFTPVK